MPTYKIKTKDIHRSGASLETNHKVIADTAAASQAVALARAAEGRKDGKYA